MAQNEPIRRVPQAAEIPDKLYFRIGDVAKLCSVPAYVLRFWESEFPQLKPNKGGTGQRLYRKRDVEMALRIKRLLYDEGYTIPGARQAIKSDLGMSGLGMKGERGGGPQLALAIDNSAHGVNSGQAAQAGGQGDRRRLQKLRGEMEELLAMLSKPVGSIPAQVAVAAPVQTIRAPRVHAFPVTTQTVGPAMDGLFDLLGDCDAPEMPPGE